MSGACVGKHGWQPWDAAAGGGGRVCMAVGACALQFSPRESPRSVVLSTSDQGHRSASYSHKAMCGEAAWTRAACVYALHARTHQPLSSSELLGKCAVGGFQLLARRATQCRQLAADWRAQQGSIADITPA